MLRKFLFSVFCLYCVSLVSSIAGMELFSNLIILVVLGAYFVARFQNQPAEFKFFRLGPDAAITIFAVAVICGAFFIRILPAGMTLEVIGEIRWIITLYVLATALVYLQQDQVRFFKIFAVLALILSAYTILQTFTGFDLVRDYSSKASIYAGMQVWRARGFFNNTMSYTYVIGTLLCFFYAASFIGYFKNRAARLMQLAAIFLSISLLFTFTRGAWIGALIAFFVIGFLHNRKLGMRLLVIGSLFIGSSYILSPVAKTRIDSIFKEDASSKSVSQRWDLWHANVAMFKDHPLLGVGYGQNSLFVQEYHHKLLGRDGFVENAHNNFLQVLAGGGIVTFLAWLYFCGYFFILALRLWHANKGRNNWPELIGLGSVGAQLFFHIGGLTQATFFDNEPHSMFLFFWALLVSQAHITSLPKSSRFFVYYTPQLSPHESTAAGMRGRPIFDELKSSAPTPPKILTNHNLFISLASNKQSFVVRLFIEIALGLELSLRILTYRIVGRPTLLLSSPPYVTCLIAAFTARCLCIPYALDIRDPYPEVYFNQQLFTRESTLGQFQIWLARRYYRASRVIFTVTEGCRENILSYLDQPTRAHQAQALQAHGTKSPELMPTQSTRPPQVHVIRNGYVSTDFADTAEKKSKFTCVFHGNLGYLQNINLLKLIVEKSAAKSDAIEFVVAGSGPQEPVVQSINSRHFQFLGDVPHERIPQLLLSTHVGLSFRDEGDYSNLAFPVKIFEYIGAGLPVLATPISPAVQELVDKKMAALFANQDVDKIVDKICKWASEFELGRNLDTSKKLQLEYFQFVDNVRRHQSDYTREAGAKQLTEYLLSI